MYASWPQFDRAVVRSSRKPRNMYIISIDNIIIVTSRVQPWSSDSKFPKVVTG